MSHNEPGTDAIFLIGITIAFLIAIITFSFIFFIVWPSNAVEDAKNTSVIIEGEEVDVTVAKAYAIEQTFYQQSIAMLNGSFWV